MRRGVALTLALFCCVGLPRAAIADPPDVASQPTGETGHDFVRDVVPALTKAGCNAGACHGSFQGRGGLKLSLLGYDPPADYEALVKASHGRRISTVAPEQSLIFRKGTGRLPHGGGRRFEAESEIAAVFQRWLSHGAPPPVGNELAGLTLRVEPSHVEFLPSQGESQSRSLQVTAVFGDGTSRDVTAWAQYEARESMIATVSPTGSVTAVSPGRTAVMVRYQGQVATVSVSNPYGPAVDFEFASDHPIDKVFAATWKRMGVTPASLCDDATFQRRVSLDLIGTLPTPEETRAFVANRSPDKRGRLVDALLERPEYVDWWALRWGDLLRAHRRYLGEKGLGSFNRWIRECVRENKPLDAMTRELLTAQGNLHANGQAAYFFVDEKVEDLAETTSQVFLGVRLQCARCHHHPNEVWSQQDYYGLAAFFTRLEMKDSAARFGGAKSVRATASENPNRRTAMAVPPRALGAAPDPLIADPRHFLADWITRKDNPYFARNFANRMWGAMFGRGLVDPVDDLRATNPAVVPEALDLAAARLVESNFDTKQLLRWLCATRVYQLDCDLNPRLDREGRLFAHRAPRRISAEALLDAINQVAGTVEAFPGQPVGTKAAQLPDPTVGSTFLATFGRPLRNNPCDCARGAKPDLSQALHLANSAGLHRKLVDSSGRIARALQANVGDEQLGDELYLACYGRVPTEDERKELAAIVAESPSRAEAWQDILWALINSAEFTFNH